MVTFFFQMGQDIYEAVQRPLSENEGVCLVSNKKCITSGMSRTISLNEMLPEETALGFSEGHFYQK